MTDTNKQAIDDLTMLCEFAYKQGFHELGYNPVKAIEAALEATQPAPAPWVMLSKKEIQDAANAAVLNRDLSWLGFSVDSNGFYTIPVLSDCHFQLAHTVLAAFIAKQGAKP